MWRTAPACNFSRKEVEDIVRSSVADSVRHHLVADVPVGAFLSGGIDSGSLVGHMADTGLSRLTGVTLSFNEFHGSINDEVPAARQIASQYGVTHHVRNVDRVEFERDLPRIVNDMDLPSIDGINTWYASKAVAEIGLKVVMSGVGGDELFFGYPSFQQVPNLVQRWRQLRRVPGVRSLARYGLNLRARRSSNPRWELLPQFAGSVAGAYFLRRSLYTPADLPELMGGELAEQARQIVSPEQLILGMAGPLAENPQLAVSQLESMIYMRNQLLRDSDWASMAHSVELRTPLVDAWLLRDLVPVMAAFGKYPGKQLLAVSPGQPLDAAIIQRRKTGFGLPMGAWTKSGGKTLAVVSEQPQSNYTSRRLAKEFVSAIYPE
jgi:asparagine synthase (glutamine-hydrolysing)